MPIEGLDPTAEAELDTSEPGENGPAGHEPDVGSMRRALRDLEAAKARVERDAERPAQELREKLMLELLPVFDNLDRTIYAAVESGEARAAVESGEARAVVEGVQLVRGQFAGVLSRFGVERIDARRQPFDPNLLDAIGTAPVSTPAAHNVVVDQIEVFKEW